MEIEEQINTYIKLAEEMKTLKQKQDILKDSIKQHLKINNQTKIETEIGFAKLTESKRTNINRKAIEEELGAEAISKFVNETRFNVLKIQSFENAEKCRIGYLKLGEKKLE